MFSKNRSTTIFFVLVLIFVIINEGCASPYRRYRWRYLPWRNDATNNGLNCGLMAMVLSILLVQTYDSLIV
ncbi:hypothetical protein WA026_014398 [Henosepilachna vigintioctopunctata]|uniref:Uncharacterized protein n=1 Tax=Henosepilachna vigintioctopunctata TaxID=420089 RepID=A0AAW1UIJ7_9CUCU